MEPEKFLEILSVAERLKCNTRHSWTSNGRRESVAEHSWRLALMALLLKDEFSKLDIDRVIRMCLIHDLGEAFTGDIPTFLKTEDDEEKEKREFMGWIDSFPPVQRSEFKALLAEMELRETEEAKLYKALDNLEAVIQHNEADIATWLPLEYELNFTYGSEEAAFCSYMDRLRAEINRDCAEKIRAAEETGKQIK